MNVQFAIKGADIYVLEVNPRASRTVPFVAKATGLPIAKIAARVMAGEKLNAFDLNTSLRHHIAVKEAVFPFARFPGVDIILGPEMRSTGEVMGLDSNFARAFLKAQMGAGVHLPKSGTVFISVKDKDKPSDRQRPPSACWTWVLTSARPPARPPICATRTSMSGRSTRYTRGRPISSRRCSAARSSWCSTPWPATRRSATVSACVGRP